MNADDISEFLERVKRAEEIGLTPAEVWRSDSGTGPNGEIRPDHSGCADCRTDLERCARCKRDTAPENAYKTGAGVFCGECSREWEG